MILDLSCTGKGRIGDKQQENTALCQQSRLLGPLVPVEHHLHDTAYLSIVADYVHPFMTTVCLSTDGRFQQLSF